MGLYLKNTHNRVMENISRGRC